MPVTFCFTLNPLQTWRMHHMQVKKAALADAAYVEEALAHSSTTECNSTSPSEEAKPSQRSRVQVTSGETDSHETKSPSEQVELAARMRRDISFANVTLRERDDE